MLGTMSILDFKCPPSSELDRHCTSRSHFGTTQPTPPPPLMGIVRKTRALSMLFARTCAREPVTLAVNRSLLAKSGGESLHHASLMAGQAQVASVGHKFNIDYKSMSDMVDIGIYGIAAEEFERMSRRVTVTIANIHFNKQFTIDNIYEQIELVDGKPYRIRCQ